MTREEAKAFLYSIASDLGLPRYIERYTLEDRKKMREAIEVLTQERDTGGKR